MEKNIKDKIIVALDYSDLGQAAKLLDQLKGQIGFYKIGLELFSSFGWEAVDLVKEAGAKVFLDLKLHDIPNTVAKTVAGITRLGVDMFTLHTLGGFNMMAAARKAADETCASFNLSKPLILGVTILTSHTGDELTRDLGIAGPVQDEVLRLANLAAKAGLDGVVSSPQELTALRLQIGNKLKYVTPGIRPEGADLGDQKRVYTPQRAIRDGADYLVIGRPITAAANPLEVVSNIYNSLV